MHSLDYELCTPYQASFNSLEANKEYHNFKAPLNVTWWRSVLKGWVGGWVGGHLTPPFLLPYNKSYYHAAMGGVYEHPRHGSAWIMWHYIRYDKRGENYHAVKYNTLVNVQYTGGRGPMASSTMLAAVVELQPIQWCHIKKKATARIGHLQLIAISAYIHVYMYVHLYVQVHA